MMAHDGRARDTQETTLEPRLLPQNAAGQLDSLPLCVCATPRHAPRTRSAVHPKQGLGALVQTTQEQ